MEKIEGGGSEGSVRVSAAFPSSVTAAPRHLPPGEGWGRGLRIATSGFALPIPFVPSGHFPLTRGIGLAMTGTGLVLAPPVGELAAKLTERAGGRGTRKGYAASVRLLRRQRLRKGPPLRRVRVAFV